MSISSEVLTTCQNSPKCVWRISPRDFCVSLFPNTISSEVRTTCQQRPSCVSKQTYYACVSKKTCTCVKRDLCMCQTKPVLKPKCVILSEANVTSVCGKGPAKENYFYSGIPSLPVSFMRCANSGLS